MRWKSTIAVVFVLLLVGGGLAIALLKSPVTGTSRGNRATATAARRPSIEYAPTAIGAPIAEFGRPLVTNVQVVDLDQDGIQDVIYCEAQKNSVRWIRQAPRGVFTEQVIGTDIPGPAHVAAADVNGSGRLDVLVASMGQVLPSNDLIGAVVILENRDNSHFEKHVVIEGIARVTDVQAARIVRRSDARRDLVVGQFGYAQGETRWLENLGNWKFTSQVVNSQSGCVHTPVADLDGDGTEDFAALISQEWEEVHVFQNLGQGRLRDALVWGSTNEDYGSSGLAVADVNRDGRPDLVYTNGDAFDYSVRGPRPWHGMQWLENRGGGAFRFHRVGRLPGAYGPAAADLNGDGSIDLVAVSGFAEWDDAGAVSIMVWLNDGAQNFTPVVVAHRPIQLITAAVGDLDGNGVPVIVTGGFHSFPPYQHMSSVTVWRRK